METFIPCLIIGAFLIVLGILNMRGNISSLHSYHRHRVREEDRLPFGRAVGLGTILCGGALVLFGTMMLVYEKTQIAIFSLVGTALLIVGLAVGLILTFRAMFKYNGGIF